MTGECRTHGKTKAETRMRYPMQIDVVCASIVRGVALPATSPPRVSATMKY